MKRRRDPMLVLAVLAVFTTGCLCSNPVILTNNGYSTVLVAISEKVPEPENLDLVQNILTAFTDASEYLHRASKNRAYFKDVTVLIPQTWKDKSIYEDATFETFEKANIRVDLPTPHRGHRPFTRTYGKCGMIGAFTHVTPVSLGLSTAGRTLVHHWAHYRWGVFDEFATRKTNLFYQNRDGSHSPTVCTAGIPAKFVDERGEVCRPGDERTRVCHYEFETGTSAQASVMFHPELPTVTAFCDSDPSSPNYHNFHALGSDQNQFCNFRSTWDVISSSDDFSGNNNPPRTVHDTMPNFKLVYYRQYAERVSLVLDVSGSIDVGTLLPRLNQEASKYINSFADGSMVGLITFSETATVQHALTEITADSHRQSLINALPSDTYGATSIGAGIQAGLTMLKPTGPGGTIVLMTDGQENTEPMIQDVWPSVLQQKVTLITIAIGEYADMSLEDLASQTSGLSFYDTEDAAHLSEIFTAISTQDSDVIQVSSGSVDVTRTGETHTGTCRIDSTVGNNTVFQFTYVCQDMSSLPASPVILYAPDGTQYDSTSPGLLYVIDTTAGTVQITIPGTAQAGLWSYSVTAGTTAPCISQTLGIPNISPAIQTSVTTRPSSDQPPVECTGTLAHTVMNFRVEGQRVQSFYLVVQRDYVCGLNADVTVFITEPTGQEVSLNMSDNGIGADMLANDGIYSTYFSGITQNGRYNVRVQVSGRVLIDGNCLAGVGESWDPFSGTTSSSSDDGYYVEIDRVVSLGSFQVTNLIPMEDYFPPSRVTDVQVDTSAGGQDTVVLQWTAPGGDLDNGQASHYEVAVSNNITTLLQDFDSAVSVQPQHCTDQADCVLTNPSGSGAQEQLVFTIPDEFSGETVYIALRGVDEMGNMGEISNIVSYNVGNRAKGPDIVITVVTVFAVVVILVTCIVGAILWKKGKLKRPPSAAKTRPTQSVRRRPDVERGEGVIRATFNTTRVPLPPIATCTVDRSVLFQAQKDTEEDLEESKLASHERGEDVVRANLNTRQSRLPPITAPAKGAAAMFVAQKDVEEDLGPSETASKSQERDETKVVATSAKQEGDKTSTQLTDNHRALLQEDQQQELDLCTQAAQSAERDEGTMRTGGNQMSDQESSVHSPNLQPPPYEELFHDGQEEEMNIVDEEEKKRQEEEKARLQEEAKKKEEEKRKKKKRKEERRRKKEEKRRKEEEEKRKAEEEQARRSEEERRRLEEAERKRAQDRLEVETPILDRLDPAIHQHDSVQLEASISDYYSAGLTDDTGLLLETEELLAALQAQKELTAAMQKRDCKQLDETIIAAEHAVSMSGKTALQPIKAVRKDLLTSRRMEIKRRAAAEKRGVVQELGHQILDADKVRRLENLRHEVLQMNQSTISEIKTYNSPPKLVHQVMVATYLLLGVNESETQNWKDLQALMGKTNREGLKRRVMRHNPDRTQLKAAMRAKQLLGDFTVEQIQDISAGAATFFVWAKGVIQEVTDRHEKVLV
ncbi:calcium-activated chloride channel regulator 3A-1-like [Branchiostoma floridae x Branchiostoma belcheri]